MTRQDGYFVHHVPKTLLIGVDAPYNTIGNIESYFEEFRSLVKTNRVEYAHEMYIKLRAIDNAYFFTKGKLEEIKALCDAEEIEHIIVSEPLSPQQERNLYDILHCKIFDRTQLILEIFEKSAHSAEGKIQVEIAMLQYQKTRMAGKGIFMSQQRGSTGMRSGPGETAKVKEARHIERTMLQLTRQLKTISKARQTQRKQRIDNEIPHLCLIGYTNTGKSTMFNALTKSGVLAEDKLFATLDTTTRELFVDGKKKGILSDTVGFIQQLPPHLIEAFKSTLSELQYADLLIHVVDISDQNWEEHIEVVESILKDLCVDKEMIYVFNKADKINPIMYAQSMAFYQPYVITSALTKEGLNPLISFLQSWTPARRVNQT